MKISEFFLRCVRLSLWLWILPLTLVACSSSSDTPYYDTNGRAIRLSTLQGQWVVVSYWATWCHACASEISEFNSLYYDQPHETHVVVLGVNYDGLQGEELEQARRAFRIHYPVLIDNPATDWGFELAGVLPQTFVINPRGAVVARFVGPVTREALEKTIHAHTASVLG